MRNLISGNLRDGIFIGIGIAGNFARKNVVQGNYIGTNADGTAGLGNGRDGVDLQNSPDNTIGGNSLAVRNVISDNALVGISLDMEFTQNTAVQGNYIGTDVHGVHPLPNRGIAGVNLVNGSSSNMIGGTNDLNADGTIRVLRGNVISGNQGAGVFIQSPNNVVQGNLIGVDANGQTSLGNISEGVVMGGGSDDSTIGGTVPGCATSSRATSETVCSSRG